MYGFYDECLKKYGNTAVWRACVDVFDCLCLSAVVDNSVLCVHGGLSPSLDTIDQIQDLHRVQAPPETLPRLFRESRAEAQPRGIRARAGARGGRMRASSIRTRRWGRSMSR